jgi:hypothetical protein
MPENTESAVAVRSLASARRVLMDGVRHKRGYLRRRRESKLRVLLLLRYERTHGPRIAEEIGHIHPAPVHLRDDDRENARAIYRVTEAPAAARNRDVRIFGIRKCSVTVKYENLPLFKTGERQDAGINSYRPCELRN